MPSKMRKKNKSKNKKDKKVVISDETVMERAKANASLWESRLEVTELSRIEYRDNSRRLAKCNEELKKQQYNLEKDTMSVLSYLRKQDQDKDNMIEKLKQQLNETKDRAQEEKDKLEQMYTTQINELEAQFNQKAREIGMIQTELKTIKQFQRRKIQVEKELEYLKDNLRVTERKHQETLRRLEARFFEEKHRLEQEAEKKIISLAERAHQEAIVKKSEIPRPSVPDYVVPESSQTEDTGDESQLQDQTFITQQVPLSHSSDETGMKETQDSSIGTY